MVSQQKQTIWTKNFISIFIINFISGFGQQLANTLIPKYASSMGVSAAMIGTIAGATAAFALAIRPLSGPAIISIDNKKLLIFSYCLNALGNLGYCFFDTAPLLLVSRACSGFGLGIGTTLCMVIASDSLPDTHIGSGLGVFSLAQAVSQAAGPSVGLALFGLLGYSKTFFIAACINCLAIVTALVLTLPQKERQPFKISLENIIAKEALRPALVLLCLALSYSTFGSFMVLYAESSGIQGVGAFFTVYAIVLLGSKPLSGWLSDRFGTKKVFVPAVVLFAMSFVIISTAKSLTMLLVAAFIAAFGYGSCQPAMQALCIRSVPKVRRGAASSTNFIGIDIGHFAGPVLAGFVIDRAGYSMMYLVAIIPVLCAAVIFFAVKSNKEPTP